MPHDINRDEIAEQVEIKSKHIVKRNVPPISSLTVSQGVRDTSCGL